MKDSFEVLISSSSIQARIQTLAEQINKDYRGKSVAFDEGPHRSTWAKQVVLADDVVKSGGSQAVGQWGPSGQAVHSSRGK